MKKLTLILIIVVFTLKVNCQIINIVNVQTGISVSKQDFIYINSMVGFSEYAGIEYWENHVYDGIIMNLNSNLGIIRKGGLFKDPDASLMFSNLDYTEERLLLNYFSINTTADFKYPLPNNLIPFLGIGPFFEILVSHNNLYRQFYEIEQPQKLGYGLLLNLGLKYSYDDFQFGIKGDYFFNFNKVSNWLGRDINARTFTISLVAGYTLNKSRSSRR
jgi:hypothetical protein